MVKKKKKFKYFTPVFLYNSSVPSSPTTTPGAGPTPGPRSLSQWPINLFYTTIPITSSTSKQDAKTTTEVLMRIRNQPRSALYAVPTKVFPIINPPKNVKNI